MKTSSFVIPIRSDADMIERLVCCVSLCQDGTTTESFKDDLMCNTCTRALGCAHFAGCLNPEGGVNEVNGAPIVGANIVAVTRETMKALRSRHVIFTVNDRSSVYFRVPEYLLRLRYSSHCKEAIVVQSSCSPFSRVSELPSAVPAKYLF